MEKVEVVTGSLGTMFNYLKMSDIARLHSSFLESLY